MKITPAILGVSSKGNRLFKKSINSETRKTLLESASDQELYKIYDACDKIAALNDESKLSSVSSYMHRAVVEALGAQKLFPNSFKTIASIIGDVFETSVKVPEPAVRRLIKRAVDHDMELIGEKDDVVLFKTTDPAKAFELADIEYSGMPREEKEDLKRHISAEGFYQAVSKKNQTR